MLVDTRITVSYRERAWVQQPGFNSLGSACHISQGLDMQFKKIYGPARIDSHGDGTEQSIKLSPTPGGRMVKNVQYMCKVLASSGSNVRISVELWHSPGSTR